MIPATETFGKSLQIALMAWCCGSCVVAGGVILWAWFSTLTSIAFPMSLGEVILGAFAGLLFGIGIGLLVALVAGLVSAPWMLLFGVLSAAGLLLFSSRTLSLNVAIGVTASAVLAIALDTLDPPLFWLDGSGWFALIYGASTGFFAARMING